ncbi:MULTISPECIES: DUF982 domain-containing protein [Neorhizobium]|jgi:hypothetical protein|uniref:DUF982 domain-containing protein n=1 Tax=Neorhizobium TaxID=1525371 RepID=UPI000560345F|nr:MULTISPECIES: DUF982 domain-containing protein [Neorhizobium]CDZ42484.1 Hypothetical protein NGAL_HAMBI1146_52510 [Neorhizobium galegae bv. officinalis]CDZ56193.1 Hypothetical protein NGAL_HAMBI2566_07430 [Neorhizobium galegae bv. orientalis]KAB1123823.1 DUF982 domain-containing protein [Neorhizobium galegae]MCQ1766650.1 DUF982 domain-containing protein [Neorhizobium galegae]MCQ1806856.1 DUF982 domain-containing protein [Neorhizobium galegae]
MNTPWNKPVVISIGEPPAETAIETTQAAAWAMIEDWPVEDGTALDRALEVCAAVDAGKRKPEEARKAFVEAAMEAHILIRA